MVLEFQFEVLTESERLNVDSKGSMLALVPLVGLIRSWMASIVFPRSCHNKKQMVSHYNHIDFSDRLCPPPQLIECILFAPPPPDTRA